MRLFNRLLRCKDKPNKQATEINDKIVKKIHTNIGIFFEKKNCRTSLYCYCYSCYMIMSSLPSSESSGCVVKECSYCLSNARLNQNLRNRKKKANAEMRKSQKNVKTSCTLHDFIIGFLYYYRYH